MFAFLQDKPIVVEVLRQPEVTRDVSVDAVLGMFALAGIAIVLAIIGGLVVGGIVILYKRWRETAAAPSDSAPADTSHVRLRI